jgi:hypothetical protein
MSHQTGPAPLSPTVQSILEQSPAGPLLHKPVDQVLAELGLPPLPQLPPLPSMPGLPPMPSLDPAALLKPITDAIGHFGSGNLGGMGSLDPTQLFSQVMAGLSEAMSLGTTAIGLLSTLEGMGAQAAQQKAAETQSSAAAVSNQAGQISSLVTTAAGVVQAGNAELAAIAAKLATEVTTAAAVPGGAPFAAAAAAEAAAESAAVVAHVKSVLGVLTTQMTAAGQPVAVTSPPKPEMAAAQPATSGLSEVAQPLTALAQPAAQALQQASRPALGLGRHHSSHYLADDVLVDPTSVGGVGAFPATGYATAEAGVGAGPTAPLAPYAEQQRPVVEDPAAGPAAEAAAGQELSAEETVAARGSAPMLPPVAAMAGARAGDAGVATPEYLVSAKHGDEVVGEHTNVATPVVGGATRAAESPDKALTL